MTTSSMRPVRSLRSESRSMRVCVALDDELVARVRAVAQPPSAVARAVAFAIDQSAAVDVGEVIIRSTAQS